MRRGDNGGDARALNEALLAKEKKREKAMKPEITYLTEVFFFV